MQTRQWSHKYAAHKSASLVIRLTLQALYKFIYSLICPLSKVGIYLKHFLYYQNLATYLVLDIFLLSLNQLITFSTRITTHKNVTCNTVIAQLAIFTLLTTFYATGNMILLTPLTTFSKLFKDFEIYRDQDMWHLQTWYLTTKSEQNSAISWKGGVVFLRSLHMQYIFPIQFYSALIF